MWIWLLIALLVGILILMIHPNDTCERFTTKPRNINAAVLYAAYNIDQHDLTFITKYSKDIPFYIVINGDLTPEAEQLKDIINVNIIQRPNIGYDSGAWKAGMKAFDLSKYDVVAFINNSCVFGGDLLRLFEHASDYDLYSYGFSYELYKRSFKDPHLHAYMFFVNNRLYNSQPFRDFWSSISETDGDHDSSVKNNEYRLKTYFEDHNFKVGTYKFFDVEDTYKYQLNDRYCPEIIKKREIVAYPEKLDQFNEGLNRDTILGYR
jgi:lipopolysaccharide biosynthesis protein